LFVWTFSVLLFRIGWFSLGLGLLSVGYLGLKTDFGKDLDLRFSSDKGYNKRLVFLFLGIGCFLKQSYSLGG
jgi:hypothetical protein